MHSFISIVDVVLNGKKTYQEWYRKNKITLIFNELWNCICEATVFNEDKIELVAIEVQPKSSGLAFHTSYKEHAIWKGKYQNVYVVIYVTVRKEVSCHIVSINVSYIVLEILNNLYDIHSELELIQLLVKLFDLELKNDDHMALAFEIKSIMHEIDATGVNIDIPLIPFIKALYPTYLLNLEFLLSSFQFTRQS